MAYIFSKQMQSALSFLVMHTLIRVDYAMAAIHMEGCTAVSTPGSRTAAQEIVGVYCNLHFWAKQQIIVHSTEGPLTLQRSS